MCCFAQPVLSVTDTQIFARLLGDGVQGLVYQMNFESQNPNAMILPLPVAAEAGDEAVEFVSLKGYERFFSDMASGFPKRPSRSKSLFSRALPSGAIDSKIAVQIVGDFVASFVPTVNDFHRLDPQFVIPRESWEKIPGYNDYGFAVFQLQEKSGKPHPMAMKFQTRFQDQVFFPTVHIHDGEVHDREEFDHTLYLQAPAYDSVVDDYEDSNYIDHSTGMVRSKRPASSFCKTDRTKGIVDGEHLIHKVEMHGVLKNRDVIRSTTPPVRSAGVMPRPWPKTLGSAAPFAAAAGGLGWYFSRRSRLIAERKQ
ncbi:MAG: hypothetical protein AAGJ83_00175 [Planctomycetota bacterium]